MAGRTAEPVIEIKVAEGGVEVVPPEQTDHAPSQPDAFGIAGRPVQNPSSFSQFVHLLTVFGGVRLARLFGRPDLAALGAGGRSR